MLKQDWGTRSVRPGRKYRSLRHRKLRKFKLEFLVEWYAPTNFLFFLRCVYKAAKVTQAGVLPYLRARDTLAGGLSFSLVTTPRRVNPPTRVILLMIYRPFECNCA